MFQQHTTTLHQALLKRMVEVVGTVETVDRVGDSYLGSQLIPQLLVTVSVSRGGEVYIYIYIYIIVINTYNY